MIYYLMIGCIVGIIDIMITKEQLSPEAKSIFIRCPLLGLIAVIWSILAWPLFVCEWFYKLVYGGKNEL